MACQRLLQELSHQKSPEFHALSPFEMEENTCFAERLSVCLPVVDFALKILVCYQSGSAWRAHSRSTWRNGLFGGRPANGSTVCSRKPAPHTLQLGRSG